MCAFEPLTRGRSINKHTAAPLSALHCSLRLIGGEFVRWHMNYGIMVEKAKRSKKVVEHLAGRASGFGLRHV